MRHTYAIAALFAALSASVPSKAQFGAEQQLLSEGPRTIDLSDLDNDGDADLVIGAREGSVLRMNTDGLGQWSAPATVHATMVVSLMADLNGDGIEDLCGGISFNGGLRWQPGMGTFGYGTEQVIGNGFTVDLLEQFDLDLDGDLDLVMALEGGGIHWVENLDGQGNFSPLRTICAGATASSLQVADMDGDGDADIIWSSWMNGTLQCAMAQGNGNFAAPVVLVPTGEGRVSDVDADGHMDVVTGDALSSELEWRRNTTGNGVLGQPQDIGAVSAGTLRMLAQDLDADGDVDLVTASSLLDEVSWYENLDGQGTFGPAQVIGVTVEDATVLAAGDIDGDGDAEVFAGSSAQNRVVYYENLTFAAGRILGRVFNDIDGDGLFNGNDHGLADVPVTVVGVGTVFTNHSGMYWIEVPTGTFAVQVAPMLDWTPTTPSQRSASLLNNGNSVHTDFGVAANGVEYRLQPTLVNGTMRCNEQIHYWVSVKNTGNQTCDVQLALALDALTTFVGADPQPTVQNGVAHWTFPSVQPGHHRYVDVIALLAGPAYMGDTLHDVLTATAVAAGAPQSTHVAAIDPVLLCAYDPNDKQVFPAGDGEAHWTPMGTRLSYTIRFQNVGNAPAEDVVIIDQLDGDLDVSTLQVVAASHTYRAIVDPSGQLQFRFEDIQLPYSASDPEGSQGYVRFTVAHHTGLAEATEVTNTAAIHFDLNPAIITNTVLNTLTYGPTGIESPLVNDAALNVYPNPLSAEATVVIAASVLGTVDLTLLDGMGRRVRTWTAQGGTSTHLDREGLPRGVYMLRATGQGLDRTVRLVIE